MIWLAFSYWIRMTDIRSVALTLSFDFLAVLELLHQEGEVVSLWITLWEAFLDHLGVGEEDSIEGETGSLNWVFVHFRNKIYII